MAGIMALPGTIEAPEISSGSAAPGGEWIVTVFDNDRNTVEEVIVILLLATGCDLREAEMETWEVHHLGKSVVHHGPQEECQRCARVILQIGIRVEVSQE